MAGPSSATTKYALPFPTDDDDVDVPRDIEALARRIEAVFSPFIPGEMKMWPTDTPPSGWYICRGQGDVPAAANPGLNAIFGSTSGWINMPDFRDRFPMGASGTAGLLSKSGSNSVQLKTTELPAHTHGITESNHVHPLSGGGDHGHGVSIAGSLVVDQTRAFPVGGGWLGHPVQAYVGGVNSPYNTAGGISSEQGSHGHPGSTVTGLGSHSHSVDGAKTGITINPNTGGDGFHENRPQYVAVNIIIKGG